MSEDPKRKPSSLSNLPPPKSNATPPATSAGSAASGAGAGGSDSALEAKLDALIGARLDAVLSQKLQTLSALSALPRKRAEGRKVTSSAHGNRALAALRAEHGGDSDGGDESDVTEVADGPAAAGDDDNDDGSDSDGAQASAAAPAKVPKAGRKQPRIAKSMLDIREDLRA